MSRVNRGFNLVFIVSVNVLFLSNSQLTFAIGGSLPGVYRKCQCPLFCNLQLVNYESEYSECSE